MVIGMDIKGICERSGKGGNIWLYREEIKYISWNFTGQVEQDMGIGSWTKSLASNRI